ncbi:hypothetical protein Poli38472_010048 [Pythium oligandrum]|uniref:Elongator complex protein 5 n=1 Tax=Pythium oligandrum TaxID=41045 RepID=A0A8K1C8M6_PYTOL|nr:hypothetical protein Poli38472_010048 [Pythium oligandrum]|eukprot:TMW58489.1 hypothetical protein Poli38472_010048 [Pythium oligandrum]
MDEYFAHKCVTSDALETPTTAVSTWSNAARCESVLVQENQQAHGASRAVLTSILAMMINSKKTSRVVFVSLENTQLPTGSASSKLSHLDYSASWTSLDLLVASEDTKPSLLTTVDADLAQVLAKSSSASSVTSARPNVIIIDSLHVLLELYSLQRVLLWVKQLRRDPRIGSVVYRVNASLLAQGVQQTLAQDATAVVHVETPSSLRTYPVLAKERRREIPKRMHGLVQLLRKKKNGRTSESVELFQVDQGRIAYFIADEATKTVETKAPKQKDTAKPAPQTRSNAAPARSEPSSQPAPSVSSSPALPVGADEVSFNLSISADEQAAKSKVELPYMHSGGQSSENNLLFIDEDDPDWDDDDLDDDLDI